MTALSKLEQRGDLRTTPSSPADKSVPATKLAWLRGRYRKNPRHALFDEAIKKHLGKPTSAGR
jgi:hypothetical protein